MSSHMKHRDRRCACAAAIAVVATACGTSGVRPGPAPAYASSRLEQSRFPRANSRMDLVEAREISTLPLAMTAYDVVQQLRPSYFFPRGVATAGTRVEPEVYLDNMRLGSAQTLKSIPVASIEDIQYLQASAASLWLPPGHYGPVILVRSRKP